MAALLDDSETTPRPARKRYLFIGQFRLEDQRPVRFFAIHDGPVPPPRPPIREAPGVLFWSVVDVLKIWRRKYFPRRGRR
jgi:hypothetical protein